MARGGGERKHLVGVEVSTPVYEAFRAVAEAEHRTMAGELRRLIEERIAAYEQKNAAA
jgi:hypothetical protein